MRPAKHLRLQDEIDESTFRTKNVELRDRIARLGPDIGAHDHKCSELAELAEKVFELSQTLE